MADKGCNRVIVASGQIYRCLGYLYGKTLLVSFLSLCLTTPVEVINSQNRS